jgi:hypothetical protein
MELDTDIRNTSGRLKTLAIAASIGLVFTYFTIRALTSSGRGPNHDPIQGSSVYLLAIFDFVITTVLAMKVLSKTKKKR